MKKIIKTKNKYFKIVLNNQFFHCCNNILISFCWILNLLFSRTSNRTIFIRGRACECRGNANFSLFCREGRFSFGDSLDVQCKTDQRAGRRCNYKKQEVESVVYRVGESRSCGGVQLRGVQRGWIYTTLGSSQCQWYF